MKPQDFQLFSLENIELVFGAFLSSLGEIILSSTVGKLLEPLIDLIKKKRKKNNERNLNGIWCVVWQTTEKMKQKLSHETLEIKQNGKNLTIRNTDKSPENKQGAYMWTSDCTLYDNSHISGTYTAIDSNVQSKGVFFFFVNPNGKFIEGKWIGCNMDYPAFAWGFAVIAKDFKTADTQIKKLINKSKKNGNTHSNNNNN